MLHHTHRILLLAAGLLPAGPIEAQPIAWDLIAAGRPMPCATESRWPPDSIRYAALDALSCLQGHGFLFARIDSHRVGTLYATPGPPATIATVRIAGAAALDKLTLLSGLSSQPGRTFDAAAVESDAQALVRAYADEGYHLARITVGEIDVSEQPAVGLTFIVDEGHLPLLREVSLLGAERTRKGFASRMSGLREGLPVRSFDPLAIRARLEETEVFSAIDTPILGVDADTMIVVQVPVTEAPPGAFDLVLGYERSRTGRGALVGSGHLFLRNLFGYGRTLSLALHRAPGQVSRISVHARDPSVFGLPVSLGAQFEGLQQDSTYGKRVYGLELGHRFEGRLHVFGTVTREVTRPGLTGLQIVGGQQRIPIATALFAGLGVRVRSVDSGVNPRSGFVVETSVENGRKDRTQRIVRADTTEESTRLQQARLGASVRVFIPTASRQTLVAGGETRLLRSREFDESDLIRFGGANSLRGYDEERFRVPFASRVTVEYRYLLDRASHALAFFDLGYVDGSRTSESLRGFFPGFGAGFQLDTDAGLISVTAAASTQAPSEVRAHLGISLGL